MATATQELVTFSQFEGKLEGNTVKGVSIIQEGPALGHGVWVDKKALEQVKKLAAGKGRLKAKLNHWSSLEDTIGYYENFRIKSGKVVADLNLFESHTGKAHLLEMIQEMPTAFGVSIMFRGDEPEYDKDNDRYNTRVRELYSADFVDTPAANRDGVFEAEIDSGEVDMGNPVPQPDAFDAKAAITALEDKISSLTTALEALKPKEVEAPKAPEPTAPVIDFDAKLEALKESLLKAFAAAPPTNQPAAPVSQPDDGNTNEKTREQFQALSHADRNAFMAAGGKLKN